ncbi:MAG: RNA-splicing ligase RtcB [Acidobacteria bacterium RIFCSPLOWO2_02_FULL_67_36]|nr:MAG: RNA-splicing ligase RtcB [Acidobacteria bacterium RIFCSPLOWO2_02_FULL_67_36]OFW26491.1 MAG: RNA-splicing ligase RtcB [Acidobacteria bacterium RIFCSPLOWO2_12_FULL_66_21]
MDIEQIDANRWRLPKSGGMRVDGIVYADETMIRELGDDQSLQQVRNVAHLPGIVGASLAMPDIHWGYGFPIGGVAATSAEGGVISPGGVGYDINCGVRLLRSGLDRDDVGPRVREIVAQMYRHVPTGVGAHRSDLRLTSRDLKRVMERGASWAVAQGFGTRDDLERVEEQGCIQGADPDLVSDRAGERGQSQLGTLGSGNHFAELQYVAEVYDPRIAAAFGLRAGQITVMIHSGSRGLGHQVCQDHLRVMVGAGRKYGIELPDRQLACAPLDSPEARAYVSAMAAAANFAFANRQVMAHWVRESVASALGIAPDRTGIETLYDVCHNIAKFETFTIDGAERRVCVHRKGATRAYPPNHPQTPDAYKPVGQPVLIPGDMGRYSYVLAGTERAFAETFGSACHGAGRKMSRGEARRAARGRQVFEEMAARGVHVLAAGMATVAEEMPEAYKDVSDVVRVVHDAGLATRVAQLRPLGVIKG